MKIDDAVDYIRNLINTEIDLSKDNFVEFERKGKGMAYAIDGSSAKLFDAYSFSVFARRVGYVFANERKVIERKAKDIEIDIIYAENADEENDARRQKEEISLAMECCGENIVMIDGALNEKIDEVVGISKKSGLKKGNIPILFIIKKFGEKNLPNKCWYYEIEKNVYAVKFHPYSRFVFRVDYYGNDLEEVLAEIASLCNDVSCLGYPYPLAEVHRLVKISREEAEYLKYELQKRVVEKGLNLEEWEDLFYDYHEYLE